MKKKLPFMISISIFLSMLIISPNVLADDLLISQTSIGTQWTADYGDCHAQSFTTVTNQVKITRAAIYLTSTETSGYGMAGISSVLTTDHTQWLCTHTRPLYNFDGWEEFSLLDCDVVPGQTYYLLFKITTSGKTADMGVKRPSPYSGGHIYSYTGYWQSIPEYDMSFKIFGVLNQVPNTPSNPSPSNHATGISVDTTLSWTGGDPDPGDTVYYDVYFEAGDSTPDILVSNGQTETSYDPPGSLNPSTTYYWQIVAEDEHGATSVGPIWDFTTEDPASQLSYSPTTINFGTHNQGWTGSSYFEIWNSGGGTLTYTITESLSWITVNPSSGSSTGEHDSITVSVVNTGSMSGYYCGYIDISSNGGSGSVFVDITINSQQTNNPPNQPISPWPENGAVDVSINTGLSCKVSDPDSDSMDVSFYLDGVFVGMDSNVPSGDRAQISLSSVLDYETTYTWYAVADDGEYTTQSPTWSFTTLSNQEIWVLLMSASDFQGTNADGDRFNNDVWAQYVILRYFYDIPRDHMRIYATQYEPNDQRPTYIDGDPTKANAFIGLDWLEQNADNNDIVWIMLSDHGISNNGNSFLIFSDGTTEELMSPAEFSPEIHDINHDVLILLLQHCYSGGFIQSCAGNNHIVMTAVDGDHMSRGIERDVDGDGIYALEPTDGFISYPSLSDHSWNVFMQFISDGLRGYADFPRYGGNGDGQVTMLEMFNFAQSGFSLDDSQLDDNGDGIPNTANDGAFADTISFGLYNQIPNYYKCVVNSDLNNQAFPPCELAFPIEVENLGDVDLVDGDVSVQIVDSDTQEVVLDNNYIVTVAANDKTYLTVEFSGYVGEFLVIITLYKDGDYIDGKVDGFRMRYNNRPSKPVIEGPSTGRKGVTYTFNFVSTDSDDDMIDYYVDFGDGSHHGWIGPYPSGVKQSVKHSWKNSGEFIITVKARDEMSITEGTFNLTISKDRHRNFPMFYRFFECFPNAFPIIRELLNL
jgi:hypothetical protein